MQLAGHPARLDGVEGGPALSHERAQNEAKLREVARGLSDRDLGLALTLAEAMAGRQAGAEESSRHRVEAAGLPSHRKHCCPCPDEAEATRSSPADRPIRLADAGLCPVLALDPRASPAQDQTDDDLSPSHLSPSHLSYQDHLSRQDLDARDPGARGDGYAAPALGRGDAAARAGGGP